MRGPRLVVMRIRVVRRPRHREFVDVTQHARCVIADFKVAMYFIWFRIRIIQHRRPIIQKCHKEH